jgi:hypothetical protein
MLNSQLTRRGLLKTGGALVVSFAFAPLWPARAAAQTAPAAYAYLGKPLFPDFELIDRSDQPPMGVGEAASTPVPAALGNALLDATGVRLRTAPFRPEQVRVALEG